MCRWKMTEDYSIGNHKNVQHFKLSTEISPPVNLWRTEIVAYSWLPSYSAESHLKQLVYKISCTLENIC